MTVAPTKETIAIATAQNQIINGQADFNSQSYSGQPGIMYIDALEVA